MSLPTRRPVKKFSTTDYRLPPSYGILNLKPIIILKYFNKLNTILEAPLQGSLSAFFRVYDPKLSIFSICLDE